MTKSSNFCKFRSGTRILDNYTGQDGLERFQSTFKILCVDSLADRSERFGTVPIYLYIQVYKKIRTVWNGLVLFVSRNYLELFETIWNYQGFLALDRPDRFGTVSIFDLFLKCGVTIDQNDLERFPSIYKPMVWNGFDLLINLVKCKKNKQLRTVSIYC